MFRRFSIRFEINHFILDRPNSFDSIQLDLYRFFILMISIWLKRISLPILLVWKYRNSIWNESIHSSGTRLIWFCLPRLTSIFHVPSHKYRLYISITFLDWFHLFRWIIVQFEWSQIKLACIDSSVLFNSIYTGFFYPSPCKFRV